MYVKNISEINLLSQFGNNLLKGAKIQVSIFNLYWILFMFINNK